MYDIQRASIILLFNICHGIIVVVEKGDKLKKKKFTFHSKCIY